MATNNVTDALIADVTALYLAVREATAEERKHLEVVHYEAQRSDDPNTQCGASIVIRSTDYKGHAHFVKGAYNWVAPEGKKESYYNKYDFILPAEKDALVEVARVVGNVDFKGAALYATMGCSLDSFKLFVSLGFKKFVFGAPDGLQWDHLVSMALMAYYNGVDLNFVKPVVPEGAKPLRFKALKVQHPDGVCINGVQQ